MEVKLNVYSDCTSEKPSKTYVVRRITFKAAKELLTLQESKEVSDEITLNMIKVVIPDFDEKDLDGIDPIELGQMFRTLGSEINGIIKTAEKN